MTVEENIKAAADACLESINKEYGPSSLSDFHLSEFSEDEWVCRAFPRRCDRPCPWCKYTPSSMPAWVQHGTSFALEGQSYRVVSVGCTNSFSPRGLHFEDFVIAELLSDGPWSLPSMPATTGDVSKSLDILFKELPRFRVSAMEKALYITSEVPSASALFSDSKDKTT